MMSRSRVKGFSLIELIVVMAIVTVLLALTGGVVQKNISQQKRIVELERLKQTINHLSYRVFYGEAIDSFRLQNNVMTITYHSAKESEKLEQIVFDNIVFVPTDFSFSNLGIVSPNQFSILVNNGTKSYPIGDFFDEVSK